MGEDRYSARGVSHGKEEVHRAIARLDKGLYTDTFCKILPDYWSSDPTYCSLLHADTAGTKAALAYLYWRETGDLSVWRGIVQDALVMNLDDMGCAGALGPFVLSSTIGRNKKRIPGEVIEALISGTVDILEWLAKLGIPVHHAGGETADVGDLVRTLDVGFTIGTRMPRTEVRHIRIAPGQLVLGIASDGQASYEDRYTSGIGSNGLTYARHEVLHPDYALRYPETVAPELDPAVVYQGNCRVTDPSPVPGMTVGELLLSPTRTYLPLLQRLHAEKLPLGGIIHTTGGGQTKVLHFAGPVAIHKDNLPVPPAVFQLLQAQRGADARELYQVFNMGVRLEIYAQPEFADAILSATQSLGLSASCIGSVREATEPQVVLTHPLTKEVYTYRRTPPPN